MMRKHLLTVSAIFLGVTATLATSGCGRSLLAIREAGDRHYARGEYEEAEKDYLEYLDRSPGRPEVHHMLGRTYTAMGKTAQAREQLLLANTLRLEDDEILASTAEGLFQDKKYDELNRLLRARTVDRGRMEDYLLLARYAEKQGDKDVAQQALLTAARVDQGMRLAPQLELAKLYKSVGDRSRALERTRMAYFVDPLNGEVLQLVKEFNQIPGPALGLKPAERP